MFEFENSPPSLNHSPSPSDQSLLPSRDTTPSTPVVVGFASGKRSEKEKEQLFPWFKRSVDIARPLASAEDNTLLQPDFDEHTFPQFGASPPNRGMADAGIAIEARQISTSPRGNQPSTLTSALKRSESGERDMMNGSAAATPKPVPTPVGYSDGVRDDAGTRPISMKGRTNENRNMRRESIAQSLGMGMSWGGISVGSWIRDDMMMSGTSPFAFHQSPSYHSSSYLPKLEANFMRDFSCCGLTLPTLHDLLQHYEEAHAQKEPVSNDGAQQPPLPDSRAAIAANTAAQIQQEAQQRSQEQQNFQNGGAVRPFSSQGNISRPAAYSSALQTIPDMDTVEDMDMDMDDIDGANESTPPSNQFIQATGRVSPPSQFQTAQPQVPQLNTNMMQSHQAYRNSTPTTPIASTRNSAAFQNASSTLMANPMQQFQDLQNPYRSTPDSSAPGTPGELDESLMSGMDDMSMANNPLFNNPNGFGGFGFGMNNDMIDLCIDEPAKRLFQPNQGNNQQGGHSRLGSGQYGANSEIAKRIREQQMLAGLPDTTTNIAPHEEPKPFRCPVIGCEKAYKNQNGLKYHKAHGHNNQRLHENGDGTFSIVNPDTQAPYPGTQGMEKEKPYKCDVCQKRYKNLNGLKYHKTHSPPCNPDLVQNQGRPLTATTQNMMPSQGMGLGNLNMGAMSGDTMMG